LTFDLSNCRFAFLDLETTGLSPWFDDRICEVGIVLTEGKRIKSTYQQLVNPQRALSPAAASTNRLTDAQLRTAPIFAEIVDEVENSLHDAVVVCHNAQFDLQFLDSEFRRLGREIQVANLIDTLFIARENFDFASNSLANIAAEFGIQNPEAHRALADALTDKSVFFGLMDALKPVGKTLDDFMGEAIYSGKRLQITYVDNKGEKTQRWVTPIQVMGLADYIYLRAYCHLRNDERTFRLDRITEIRVEVSR
jgi:DNA polymerase III epsilon subunit family exonuclease